MKVVYIITLLLVIVGGINWGLVGLFDYNLVDMLFGEGSVITRIVYSLVGLSAVYALIMLVLPSPDRDKKTTM